MVSIESFMTVCLLVVLVNRAHALQASASWVYRGINDPGSQSTILNMGDSLAIECLGRGGNPLVSQATNMIMAFVITLNQAPTKVSITPSSGANYPTLNVDKGKIIYDSIQGNSLDYSHIFTSVYMPITTPGKFARGIMIMLLPTVKVADAGTYYCTFVDGSSDSSLTGNTSVGSSQAFKLLVRLKPGQRSGSIRSSRNKLLEYSSLLLTVSKLIY